MKITQAIPDFVVSAVIVCSCPALRPVLCPVVDIYPERNMELYYKSVSKTMFQRLPDNKLNANNKLKLETSKRRYLCISNTLTTNRL